MAYRIDAYADRIGWREVVAVGDRTTLTRSDVPATGGVSNRNASSGAPASDRLKNDWNARSLRHPSKTSRQGTVTP